MSNTNGISGGLHSLWTVVAFDDNGLDGTPLVGTAMAVDLDMAAGLVCAYLPVLERDSHGYYLVATRTGTDANRSGRPAPAWISKPFHNGAGWTTGPWSALEGDPAAEV
ncbi:hypothetical protein ACFQZZ_30645 [Nocardia sp. GCM10030253]|uniref:hypothetical protein n=1 Tax=Nocardia sp. GCM10030253 TaxID=3273404 RepID=UPI003632083F